MVKHLIIEVISVMAASIVISFVVHAAISLIKTAFKSAGIVKDGETTA